MSGATHAPELQAENAELYTALEDVKHHLADATSGISEPVSPAVYAKGTRLGLRLLLQKVNVVLARYREGKP